MREIWIYTIDRVINRSFSRWNLWIYYFRLRLRLSKMRLHLFNSAVTVNSKMDYSHLELEIFSELSGIRILLLSNSKVCTNNNYCCCRSGVIDCAWRRDELRFPSNLTSTRCTRLFILCAWKKIFTGCESQPIPSCKCRELQTVQRCQQETISTVLLDT